MKKTRRRLLGALGAATATGGVLFGTGAFSSVEADRQVTIDVASDENALLVLAPNNDSAAASGGVSTLNGPGTLDVYGGDTSQYLDTSDDPLALDLSDANITTAAGVNDEGRTVFRDLIRVENQGTQDTAVDVSGAPNGLDLYAYGSAAGGPVALTQHNFPVQLPTGTVAGVTVRVDTTVFDTSTSGTLTVVADADQTANQPATTDTI